MAHVKKIAFLAVMGLFSASTAQGACTLGDLRGTWFAEGMGGNIAGHCKLVFGSSGALISGVGGSECSYEQHTPDGFSSVTLRASGKLALVDTENCGFAGALSVGGAKLNTSTLALRMSAGKDLLTASGPVTKASEGRLARGHTSVGFTAVKKKP